MVNKVAGIGAIGATGVAGACGGFYLLSKEKTIGDRVSKSGLILIKSGDTNTWKLAAKHLKASDTSLVTDLTTFDPNIRSTSDLDLEKAKVALEKWCQDATGKDLSEKNINLYLKKVQSRCTIPPTDIRSKLERESKHLVSDWSGKFTALKAKTTEDTTLETDLKAKDSSINTNISTSNNQMDGKYSDALKKWCESQLDIKLENDSYVDIYTKVTKRCLQA
ncbi:hypothetical protein HF1_01640 [Mycoplasma haemofelis str. Langford 1]|uniref:Lipoprotein n=2 Tax=Mycoplasma haemofelis TaxID=29501 RepID=F6FG18_MYCHI|nr:hypothetical protein [Mycoplasma haemofelis]AEG72484.1 hypothetical protein MHF_0185 [Mycoplasma haemofelis Ohio2]CBY92172.1 hypothetical protein HF1_01640 [Mycoplasma haemofelis str. Langford 1]